MTAAGGNRTLRPLALAFALAFAGRAAAAEADMTLAKASGCTACHACALICPDFVFQVWKYDEPVEHESTGDAA